MMKLSQRMINNFCASISVSNGHRWTTLSVLNDVGVRVTVHKSTDPGQPNGVVLSAATSIWLPVSSHNVFQFLWRRESTSTVGCSIQWQFYPRDCSYCKWIASWKLYIRLRAYNSSHNMLILQESCTDSSGTSLVVYASVDLPAINIAMSGEDPSYIPLLPSGFVILPDGRVEQGAVGASTSSALSRSGGLLVTIAFQILVSSLPNEKLNLESVNTVNT